MTRRRKQLGWTSADLARAIGSSPSRISKLEKGDASVSASLVVRALKAMNCTIDATPLESLGSADEYRTFGQRLLRRRKAEVIALREKVDAGDVEQALANLKVPPMERLARSLGRAQLRRLPPVRR